MAKIGELIVKIGADMTSLTKGLQESQKKLQNFGNKAKAIGGTMTAGVTVPLVAAGAASFKMAADLQDAMGATDQIFKGSSAGMKQWADGLESYYGIAEGQALEYGNMMGSMLKNIGGLTEEEAAKQSQTLIKLAGDLTAMYGGTTESAVQALTGALKGNNTMLDNYGMAANDAMIKTKALEMGLYTGTGQMDLATKQAATLALIMEQSGAAQGQAAREAEGASGTMRAITTEIKNLTASLGESLLPVITPVIAKLNDLMRHFSAMSPETQKTIVVIAGLAAVIGPVLLVLGAMATGISAISAALPILGGAFAVITGPIALVAAAIVGVIALAAVVIKNWTPISSFFTNLWDGIKNKTLAIWEAIKEFLLQWWPYMVGALAGPVGLLAALVYDNWAAIQTKTNEIWNTISGSLLGVWTSITTWGEKHWTNFKNMFLGIWAAIVGGLKGYVNGIIGMVNAVIGALNSIDVTIPNWVPEFGGNTFGINIPKVPMLAQGGIVTRPTLIMAGEAGSEAIVPLGKNGGIGSTITFNIYGATDPDAVSDAVIRKLALAGVK